jgi:hypothetical protein
VSFDELKKVCADKLKAIDIADEEIEIRYHGLFLFYKIW